MIMMAPARLRKSAKMGIESALVPYDSTLLRAIARSDEPFQVIGGVGARAAIAHWLYYDYKGSEEKKKAAINEFKNRFTSSYEIDLVRTVGEVESGTRTYLTYLEDTVHQMQPDLRVKPRSSTVYLPFAVIDSQDPNVKMDLFDKTTGIGPIPVNPETLRDPIVITFEDGSKVEIGSVPLLLATHFNPFAALNPNRVEKGLMVYVTIGNGKERMVELLRMGEEVTDEALRSATRTQLESIPQLRAYGKFIRVDVPKMINRVLITNAKIDKITRAARKLGISEDNVRRRIGELHEALFYY